MYIFEIYVLRPFQRIFICEFSLRFVVLAFIQFLEKTGEVHEEFWKILAFDPFDLLAAFELCLARKLDQSGEATEKMKRGVWTIGLDNYENAIKFI